MEAPAERGLAQGEDGFLRCAWGLGSPEYVGYHDTEWGVAVRGDTALFERITLEAFQSGLSWITVLRKREAFRSAFCGFDPVAVASFGAADVERLMADPAIIRNRRKITAAIVNAGVVLNMWTAEGPAALTQLMWSFHVPRPRPRRSSEVPSRTGASEALSRALKDRGMTFVGPTTMYAAMQACGIVDDHLSDCYVAAGGGG